ncbi:hypothetical protein GCM10022248_00820 [Nonomuraea soli]
MAARMRTLVVVVRRIQTSMGERADVVGSDDIVWDRPVDFAGVVLAIGPLECLGPHALRVPAQRQDEGTSWDASGGRSSSAESCTYVLGVKGSQVQILSSRRLEQAGRRG